VNGKPGHACKGLFVTDLDGTLLGTDGRVAQKNLDALKNLNRLGIRTAVATGRSLYSFINSTGAGLPVDFVIFTTGAGVVTQTAHELLYHVNLPSGMVAQSLAFMQRTALDFMLHHPVPDNHRFVYRRANRDNADFESRLEHYRQFGRSLDDKSLDGFGAAAQFLAVVPPAKSEAVLRELGGGLPGLSIIHSTSPLDHASTWIELFHPDVSKGKTAAWLASELGVDASKTMAVGNDFNDLDLLEWAADSYVVANAPDGLKRRFQQVASNDNGGVAEAISRWLDFGISR
jgi:Cof subfamily protein (haloacid dehalogenase superfamily)